MKAYSLDTNACIALLAAGENPVRKSFEKALSKGRPFFVSSIVEFELWYGVYKSSRKEENAYKLQTFFNGPVQRLPLSAEDAFAAGKIRADLERNGKKIGTYDTLIAGQALSRKLVLVTSNISEFSRVENLNWEDWGKV